MKIELTEGAAKQIQKQITQRGKGIGLRVGVKDAGCSGFAYVYDYADEVKSDDKLFEAHDAKVVGGGREEPRNPRWLHPRFRQGRPEAGIQVHQPQRGRDLRLRRILQREGKAGNRG